MKPLSEFGSASWPLHPSGLRSLITCNWSSVMRYLYQEGDGESGPAADTGSATHVAVREFHRGKELADCIKTMDEEAADYPRADLVEAAGLFLAYAGDAQNSGANVILVEEPISFEIAPTPDDPTGAPIVIQGTVDQVREVDGVLKVFDLKTSKLDPMELLLKHTTQVAGYCIGASVKLGRPVEGGGLILPRRYPKNAFWHYPWRLRDIEQILLGVRHTVAMIRRGITWHNPSDELCRWCFGKSPDHCLPKLQETLEIVRRAA